jgi:predicted ribosome quality control (RQC) complex YloA/Tae2 family protein
MGMDSAVIRALCLELSGRFEGSRVERFEQVDPWEFLVGTNRGAIVFSCHPKLKRLVRSAESRPSTSTHFARTGADLLKGVSIKSVAQRDFDRIVELEFRRRDLLEGQFSHKLVVELLGGSGNALLLTQDDKIIAILRKSRRHRVGDPYKPPRTPSWVDPGTVSREKLAELLGGEPGASLAERVQSTVMGLSPLLAREALYRGGLSAEARVGECSKKELHEVARQIADMYVAIQDNRFEPSLYLWEGEPVDLSCFKLGHLSRLERIGFSSMNDAALGYYSRIVDRERLEEKRVLYLRALNGRIRSVKKRLEKQEADAKDASEYEKFKMMADAILSSIGEIRSGVSSVSLENPYEPGTLVEVSLPAGRSPQETAQDYYSRYKKGKRALPALRERISSTAEALAELNRLKSDAETLGTLEDARRFADILLEKGILEVSVVRKGRAARRHRVFITSNGWEVVVGRSGEENDEVTFHVARPKDLFFHVSGASGSHTIMKVQGKGKVPGKKDIEEAASIAAYYSKARTSKLVPVAYAERRHVRKPRKAPPGTVIVEREKVLMVEPRAPKSSLNQEHERKKSGQSRK